MSVVLSTDRFLPQLSIRRKLVDELIVTILLEHVVSGGDLVLFVLGFSKEGSGIFHL